MQVNGGAGDHPFHLHGHRPWMYVVSYLHASIAFIKCLEWVLALSLTTEDFLMSTLVTLSGKSLRNLDHDQHKFTLYTRRLGVTLSWYPAMDGL